MKRFSFSRFIFSIKGETRLLLPAYKGSTLRGGFGHAFRRIVCVMKAKECVNCLLKNQCVYSWVFETPVPDDARMMRKYTAAPHPFVIEPPMDEQKSYQAEETFSFGLVLIGRAIDYLPYFIYAFEELGRIGIGKGKGKFQLVEVAEDVAGRDEPAREKEAAGGEEPVGGENTCHFLGDDAGHRIRVIYQGKNKMLSGVDGPVRWVDIVDSPPSGEVSLSFLTPTRIKYENSLTKEPEFHILFRNLLRRISLLSYFHCGEQLDSAEFGNLIEQARQVKTVRQLLHWEDWERYSNRQEARMKMGGFVGEVCYAGDMGLFWPYIRLGEWVHVGKGSSFGLGRYGILTAKQIEQKRGEEWILRKQ